MLWNYCQLSKMFTRILQYNPIGVPHLPIKRNRMSNIAPADGARASPGIVINNDEQGYHITVNPIEWHRQHRNLKIDVDGWMEAQHWRHKPSKVYQINPTFLFNSFFYISPKKTSTFSITDSFWEGSINDRWLHKIPVMLRTFLCQGVIMTVLYHIFLWIHAIL